MKVNMLKTLRKIKTIIETLIVIIQAFKGGNDGKKQRTGHFKRSKSKS